MATTLTKITPYTGLCKLCLNLTRVQAYVSDTFEQEGIQVYRCSVVPDLIFEDIVYSDVDADSLSLKEAQTSISNCNRFTPGAFIQITNVTYDAGTTTLTIDYLVDGAVGTPNIDFFFVANTTAVGSVATISDGTGSLAIVSALADDVYYLYARLTTTELSIIYPFQISTI